MFVVYKYYISNTNYNMSDKIIKQRTQNQNIPNIIHFINLGPRTLSMLHFISIYSAHLINKPDKIYVYCDQEHSNNDIYWDILVKKNIITAEIVANTEYHKGIYLDSYQYRADVLRLEKLVERGGIYMDLDILSLKPLTPYLNNCELVMGIESSKEPDAINLDEVNSITNAVIMAKPDNAFLKDWYDQLADNLFDKPWAYHAVALPKEILQNNKDKYDILILPRKIIMPFDFRETYFLDDNCFQYSEKIKDACTVHMWETIWNMDNRLNFTVQYFSDVNSIFTQNFNKYLLILKENKYLLENIIHKLYKNQGSVKKLYEYTNMYIQLCKRYDIICPGEILYYNNCASSIINDNNVIQCLPKRKVIDNNRNVGLLNSNYGVIGCTFFTNIEDNMLQVIPATSALPSNKQKDDDIHITNYFPKLNYTGPDGTTALITFDTVLTLNGEHYDYFRMSLTNNDEDIEGSVTSYNLENVNTEDTEDMIIVKVMTELNTGDVIGIDMFGHMRSIKKDTDVDTNNSTDVDINTDTNDGTKGNTAMVNIHAFNLQVELL